MSATDSNHQLKALFLNCTLKQSPATSNTDAFIDVASKVFNDLEVKTETIRVVDYHVSFGNTSDEKGEDEWPKILKRIYAADMLIIATPIWRGDRSSVAKMVVERMDGIMSEGNDKNGQYPTFNKVAGVMVDGNEDGAKKPLPALCWICPSRDLRYRSMPLPTMWVMPGRDQVILKPEAINTSLPII